MIRIIAVVSFIFLSFGWGNVQECTQCHEKIVHEWSTSAHAMAHKTKNELFAKMLGSVAKAKGSSPLRLRQNVIFVMHLFKISPQKVSAVPRAIVLTSLLIKIKPNRL